MELSKGDAIAVTFALEREGAGEGDTFSARISDESIVHHGPLGNIRLAHTPEAIDFSRAQNGLVMLFGHDDREPIGRVHNIRLDPDRAVRGDFTFSTHASAERYRAQVADGTLTDVSVGADILDFAVDEADDEIVNITRWRPHEVSLVSVGRIPTARIGFSHTHEDAPMGEETQADTVEQPETKTAGQVLASHNRAAQAHQGKGIEAERARQKGIRALFGKPRFAADEFQVLMGHCLDEGLTLEQAQAELLDYIGFNQEHDAPATVPFAPSRPEPQVSFAQAGNGRRTQVSVGASGEEKLAGGIALALSRKVGHELSDTERREADASGFVGMSLLEMGREMLRARGVNVGGLGDKMTLAHQLLLSHGTSDFPNVLANIASKSAMLGYNEAPETWAQWAKVGNLTDFKQANRVTTTAFPDLDKIPENGEYKFATISDVGEPIQLATYGKKFRISRQALINDDLNAFSDVPRKMGRAAARTPGDLAYAVLTANATLSQDATTLFHANHGNLGTAGAPSVATLQEGFYDMAVQKDPDDNVTALNIEPMFIIGPRALRSAMKVLIGSEKDPTYDATNPGTPINEFYNALTVVTDARLDGDSATAWYLAASPMQADTVEVAFLNGNQSPTVEMLDMTSPDGRDYYVRLDAAAAALGYVGLWKNVGA